MSDCLVGVFRHATDEKDTRPQVAVLALNERWLNATIVLVDVTIDLYRKLGVVSIETSRIPEVQGWLNSAEPQDLCQRHRFSEEAAARTSSLLQSPGYAAFGPEFAEKAVLIGYDAVSDTGVSHSCLPYPVTTLARANGVQVVLIDGCGAFGKSFLATIPRKQLKDWLEWVKKTGTRDDDPLLVCQDCSRQWHQSEVFGLHTVDPRSILERVAPGEPMPYGECPVCRALCHPR